MKNVITGNEGCGLHGARTESILIQTMCDGDCATKFPGIRNITVEFVKELRRNILVDKLIRTIREGK